MKQVVMTVVLLGVVVALCFGIIFPTATQLKDVGNKAYNSVKTLNNNIAP